MPPNRSVRPLAQCGDDELTSRCLDIQRQDERIREVTRRFIAHNGTDPRVSVLDLDVVLCSDGPPCPVLVDEVEVRLAGWDSTHFTAEGASFLAPTLARAVETAMAAPIPELAAAGIG